MDVPHAVAWRFSVADARQVLNAKKTDQTDMVYTAYVVQVFVSFLHVKVPRTGSMDSGERATYESCGLV